MSIVYLDFQFQRPILVTDSISNLIISHWNRPSLYTQKFTFTAGKGDKYAMFYRLCSNHSKVNLHYDKICAKLVCFKEHIFAL